MQKTLCIIGTTATGKTALALSIASKLPSVIISADSRQVYKGMDIVTGKDHPKSIDIAGVDLVDPDYDFSVSDWLRMVEPNLKEAKNQGKLVIVVGGTGFYVKALIDPPNTLHTPPSKELRASLSKLSLEELQTKLSTLDKKRYQNMNNSDNHNPRRLIRAIEVALSHDIKAPNHKHYDVKIVGLTQESSQVNYLSKIEKRVKSRLDQGAISETQSLINKYQAVQSLTAIGYRTVTRYLNQDISYEQMIIDWTLDEYRYSKRQNLYFKKYLPACTWYEANGQEVKASIEKDVKTWYDKVSI